MKLEFIGVNTNKLHDELIAVGIMPKLVESLDGITWVTVDDNQLDAVNTVVAVHDPVPVPQPSTEMEILQKQVSENQGAIDFIVMNF